MIPSRHSVTFLDEARAEGRGVGAFNVILLEHAEAILQGASAAGRPVILQISQNCIAYHGGLEPIVTAALALARRADVAAVVHLDHADSFELVREAVNLGVTSVMYDASVESYERNVRQTRRVVDWCHTRGVAVEAELGEVGGKDGVHAPGARTDPDEAARFVRATGVDSLAVAVGTSHAMTERVAELDVALISRLHESVSVPLVLHGSSGASDENLVDAVGAGISKVNISTHLNGLFTQAIRDVLEERPQLVDPRRYLTAARGAVAEEVSRLLALLDTGVALVPMR